MMHRTPVETVMAGDRVQLHPATDLWMQGCRYGSVLYVGRSSWLTIDLDNKAEAVKVHINDIYAVYPRRLTN